MGVPGQGLPQHGWTDRGWSRENHDLSPVFPGPYHSSVMRRGIPRAGSVPSRRRWALSRLRVWSVVIAVSILLMVLVWIGRGVLRQPRIRSGPPPADTATTVEPPARAAESDAQRASADPSAFRGDVAPPPPDPDAEPERQLSEERHEPGVLVKAIWADDHTPAADVAIVASVPGDPTLENLPPRMRRDALRFRSNRKTERTDDLGEAWFGDL